MKLVIRETTYYEIDVPHVNNAELLEEQTDEILSNGLNHGEYVEVEGREVRVEVVDSMGGVDYQAVNDFNELNI